MSFATLLLDFSKTSLSWQRSKVLFKPFTFRLRRMLIFQAVCLFGYRNLNCFFKVQQFFSSKIFPFLFQVQTQLRFVQKWVLLFLQKSFLLNFKLFCFKYINVFQKCFLLGTDVFFRSHFYQMLNFSFILTVQNEFFSKAFSFSKVVYTLF